MELTSNTFDQLGEDTCELLQKTLQEQLQNHFNLLVEAVPTIKCIEWTTEQEDEMVFSLIDFHVVKNNGYRYEYHSHNRDNPIISSEEFNNKEIELISGFQHHLDTFSHLIVALCGNDTFRLDTEPAPIVLPTTQKMKI
jgi:hypothetical protein